VVGISIEWILRARMRAQMNASRSEADSEYSRGDGAFEGPDEARREAAAVVWQRRYEWHRAGILAAGLIGAVILLVAEFTPLLHLHTAHPVHIATTVRTGANHSYALIPIAVLSAMLTYSVWRSGSRFSLLALGLLGFVALGIALLGDLPDAHSSGLVGSLRTGLQSASTSPSIGLFLEVLGAVVVILTAAGGMLLEPSLPAPRAPRRPPRSRRARSAS
jgi:hypothetical protein